MCWPANFLGVVIALDATCICIQYGNKDVRHLLQRLLVAAATFFPLLIYFVLPANAQFHADADLILSGVSLTLNLVMFSSPLSVPCPSYLIVV